jgi:hypothetical protein
MAENIPTQDEKRPEKGNNGSDPEAPSIDESDRAVEKAGLVRRIWNWKPRPARYDPEDPPEFTVWLNILFGLVSPSPTPELRYYNTEQRQSGAFTVATLYYNQAILNRIAETFHVSFEKASSVATLMQAGYATGLLFICPLGDLFRRRPFILALIGFTATLVSTVTA